MADSQHRFEALDGLRGVAAIAVVFYHVGHWLDLPNFVRHGYLAVDIFFCLSGFVMASAYEKRLVEGMSFGDFVWRRVVRLWPLIVLGAVLGAAYEVTKILGLADNALSAPALAVAFACGALLIPMLWQDRMYPLNDPTWSLLLEVVINFVWAITIKGLRTRILLIVIVVAAAALAYLARKSGSVAGGHNVETLGLGFARVVVSYTMGLLLYRIHQIELIRLSLPTSVLAAVVVAILIMPSLPSGAVIYDLAVVLGAVPAIILLAANQVRPVGHLWKISGDISYPLYVLHHPLWFLSTATLAAAGLTMNLTIAIVLGCAFVGVAWVALTIYDEPTRRALTMMSKRGYGAAKTVVPRA